MRAKSPLLLKAMSYNEYGYRKPKQYLIDKFDDYIRDIPMGLWKIIAIILGYPLVLAIEAVCGTVKICFMLVFFIFFIDEIFRSGPAKLPKR